MYENCKHQFFSISIVVGRGERGNAPAPKRKRLLQKNDVISKGLQKSTETNKKLLKMYKRFCFLMNFHLKILKIFSNFSISFDFLSKSAKNSSKIFSLYYKMSNIYQIIIFLIGNEKFHSFSSIFPDFQAIFRKICTNFPKIFSFLYIFN